MPRIMQEKRYVDEETDATVFSWMPIDKDHKGKQVPRFFIIGAGFTGEIDANGKPMTAPTRIFMKNAKTIRQAFRAYGITVATFKAEQQAAIRLKQTGEHTPGGIVKSKVADALDEIAKDPGAGEERRNERS